MKQGLLDVCAVLPNANPQTLTAGRSAHHSKSHRVHRVPGASQEVALSRFQGRERPGTSAAVVRSRSRAQQGVASRSAGGAGERLDSGFCHVVCVVRDFATDRPRHLPLRPRHHLPPPSPSPPPPSLSPATALATQSPPPSSPSQPPLSPSRCCACFLCTGIASLAVQQGDLRCHLRERRQVWLALAAAASVRGRPHLKKPRG